MNHRRVGLWFIGACGGVGSTAAFGVSALKNQLTDGTGLVTELPLFDGLELDRLEDIVIGGHDIRRSNYYQSITELHHRSNLFDEATIQRCRDDLETWSKNIRPGTIYNSGATIRGLADDAHVQNTSSATAAIKTITDHLREFQDRNRLNEVVVINVASTEPPCPTTALHGDVDRVMAALEKNEPALPASALYAWATINLGIPYINFTPSLGASFPAAEQLALKKNTVLAGQDGKTGETLLKTVLAPMFAHRNLQVLSWVGHNIFGNRDGQVLNDPANKESKIRTKDRVTTDILGYKPQTHVSIEYIESLDDWKTAWDHIHFRGFLGTKMIMQFIWQGCDSILAAPLVLDLARLALFAKRRGETGILRHLACFFKNPMGVEEHDFFKQWEMLVEYVRDAGAANRACSR